MPLKASHTKKNNIFFPKIEMMKKVCEKLRKWSIFDLSNSDSLRVAVSSKVRQNLSKLSFSV